MLHECTLTAFTTNPISNVNYGVSSPAKTLANLNWSIDKTPLCDPITYTLLNQGDLSAADASIFTVGASTASILTSDLAKVGTYNLILKASVGSYASA